MNSEVVMKAGVWVPLFDELADPLVAVELAVAALRHDPGAHPRHHRRRTVPVAGPPS